MTRAPHAQGRGGATPAGYPEEAVARAATIASSWTWTGGIIPFRMYLGAPPLPMAVRVSVRGQARGRVCRGKASNQADTEVHGVHTEFHREDHVGASRLGPGVNLKRLSRSSAFSFSVKLCVHSVYLCVRLIACFLRRGLMRTSNKYGSAVRPNTVTRPNQTRTRATALDWFIVGRCLAPVGKPDALWEQGGPRGGYPAPPTNFRAAWVTPIPRHRTGRA